MAGTTDRTGVDPSNAAQARAWDGDEGAFWAEHADRFDAAIVAYDEPFSQVASIGPADRVLDVGCGTGATTRAAARAAVSGAALGVDLSARMLARARELAASEQLDNASFLQADAQIHPFEPGAFDVCISRTGAMFFGEPIAAFANLAGALRPGGRLVLLTWQPFAANEWIREFTTALAAGRDLPAPPPDAPGPFALSEDPRIRSVLGAAGFTDVELGALTAGMYIGRDVDEALDFVLGVAGWMLEGLDDDGRVRALDALRTTIVGHETPDGVIFDSATWLVSARRP